MQKYTVLLLFERLTRGDVAFKFVTSVSQASFRLSSFWLSGHLCIATQFISEFI